VAAHLLRARGGGFGGGALAKSSRRQFCEQQGEVLVAAHLLRAGGGGFGGSALAKSSRRRFWWWRTCEEQQEEGLVTEHLL
jgi:hypothetical protein